ncbi:MAG: ABC transporter permease [Oscillospiraceae bacterium]|jgi:oligopeptide transport system permease protein|nr:ABC transporter permease [Oscillospiraceae bacterium]
MSTLNIEELLEPLEQSQKNDEFIAIESKPFLRDVWERFCGNKRAVMGLIMLAVIITSAIFGSVLSPYTYDGQNVAIRNQPLSAEHWFGTDKFGRDLFTRAMYGTRISLLIGFVSTAVSALFGTAYGGISGYFGKRVDMVMMRLCDILYAIPALLYVILIMLIFGSNVKSILIGICVSGWVGISRIVRSQVMALREREYALAAYVLGATRRRIFFKHLLSNSMGPILVTLTLMIPQAIFMEAFLSFIGIGISAPQASLGTLVQDAKATFQVYPSQILFPILVICLVIFALSFISKGLEEALDPKYRR